MQVVPGATLAEHGDGVGVGVEEALGIGLGERGLAQHVERIAVLPVCLALGPLQGLVDVAAHHELVAHDAHGLAHGQADGRFATAAHQAAQRAGVVLAGVFAQMDHAPGQHQAPGRGIDQHRLAATQMLVPVGVAQLVADQAVDGGAVGNPQQGLGHAHQQHALLAGQVVLTHEELDGGLVVSALAYPAHQIRGLVHDLPLFVGWQGGALQQGLDNVSLG